MRNFDFYSPTYFVFGKDREAETGRYVKRFGGSRVLVVYGGSLPNAPACWTGSWPA